MQISVLTLVCTIIRIIPISNDLGDIMVAKADLVGNSYGKLYVVAKTELKKNGQSVWFCHCDCRNFKLIRTADLTSGRVVDCGCRFKGQARENSLKHGYWGSKPYSVVTSVLSRCYSKSKDNYSNYGGRGITICDEWKSNLGLFCKWLEDQGLRDGLQIDRIDNDSGYSPSNCRLLPVAFNIINKRGYGRTGVCGVKLRDNCSNNPYLVQIRLFGIKFNIARSKTLLDAASVRISVTNKICNRVALLCKEQRDIPIKDLEPQFIKIVEEEISKYK